MAEKRRNLTYVDVAKIIQEWNEKSVEDFARELGVAKNTIRSWVTEIRKKAPDKCPKKNRKKKRQEIVDEALQMVAELELEQQQDVISD